MNTKQIIIRPAIPSDAPIIASEPTMAPGEETMKKYCGKNSQDVLEELAEREESCSVVKCGIYKL